MSDPYFGDFYVSSFQARTLPYPVDVDSYGISSEQVNWCIQNCKSTWGFYFVRFKEDDTIYHLYNNPAPLDAYKEQKAYMAFECQDEAVLFSLSNGFSTYRP